MPEWGGKTGGGDAKQGMLMRLMKHVNIRVIYCFLPFVVCGYLIFAPKRAYAIYSYLRRRQGFSFFKAAIGTYRNHILFGKFLMDRFYVFAGHKDRYTVVNLDEDMFYRHFNTPNPLVLVGAHVGNFEISSYLCGKLEKKLNVLTFAGETEKMKQMRSDAMEDNNIEMIGVSQDMEYIFKLNDAFSANEAVTLTGDRVFTGRRRQKFSFLGKEAWFPTGIYSIADRYKASIVVMFVLGTGKNFEYKVYAQPLAIDDSIKGREARARAYGQAYMDILEKIVKEHPLQWFNFYDFWKIEDNENN